MPRKPDEKYERLAREQWLMPDKPIFSPLISEELFWRVFEKLNRQGEKRAPRNENLLLSGLLFCSHCGKKMAGQYKANMSAGKRVDGFTEYYRCSTYMKFGINTESKCLNHGVSQKTLMPLIQQFLQDRGKTLQDLLSNRYDTSSLIDLLIQKQQTDKQAKEILQKIHLYLAESLSGTGVPYPDVEDNPHTLLDFYDQLFESQKKELTKHLADLEKEHSAVTEQYFKLPPKAQEKAVARLTDLENQIAAAKTRLEPLTAKWEDLFVRLAEIRERLAEARIALEKGSLRQQAEALRKAIDKIELEFDHKNGKKPFSVLRSVRIVPLIGSTEVLSVVSGCQDNGKHVWLQDLLEAQFFPG